MTSMDFFEPTAPHERPVMAGLIPQLINNSQLKWEKTIPATRDKSPEYAILYTDPKSPLTYLMF